MKARWIGAEVGTSNSTISPMASAGQVTDSKAQIGLISSFRAEDLAMIGDSSKPIRTQPHAFLGLAFLACMGTLTGCSPRTEQAVGTGLMGVGAAAATVEPATGVGLATAGAALTAHGAYREEQSADSK